MKRITSENGLDIVEEIHKVIVHRFKVSDVEDPEPIIKWQESEAGKFVMSNAKTTPIYHRQLDSETYGHKFVIIAELEKKKYSEFLLRFGTDGNY